MPNVYDDDDETLIFADEAAWQEAAWQDEVDEGCEHDHDDECYDEVSGFLHCSHYHCINCGECSCPGYCDDHQTYNVRPPSETGGLP